MDLRRGRAQATSGEPQRPGGLGGRLIKAVKAYYCTHGPDSHLKEATDEGSYKEDIIDYQLSPL